MTSTGSFNTQSFSYGGTGPSGRADTPSIRAEGYLDEADSGSVSEGWKVGAIILIVLFVLAFAGLITFAILWSNLNTSTSNTSLPAQQPKIQQHPSITEPNQKLQEPAPIANAKPVSNVKPKGPENSSTNKPKVLSDEDTYPTAEDYVNILLKDAELDLGDIDFESTSDVENDEAFRLAAALNQSVKTMS